MTNKAKKKGTAGETRVVNYLNNAGLRASRVVMKGGRDEGDVHLLDPQGYCQAILEVKSGRQTSSVSRGTREEWLKETRRESQNAQNVRGFLVIAKHGSSVKDYHVWSSDGRMFWYLDEFASYVRGGFEWTASRHCSMPSILSETT